MATKGYYAGTMQLVHVPNKKKPQVLLWACHKGLLIESLSPEGMDEILEDTADTDMYIQWLEYFNEDKEEPHANA